MLADTGTGEDSHCHCLLSSDQTRRTKKTKTEDQVAIMLHEQKFSAIKINSLNLKSQNQLNCSGLQNVLCFV